MLRFEELQRLDTYGCHDADFARIGGRDLLFLSEDRSPASATIESSLLEFSAASGCFELLQKIPTDGAHAAELFEGPGGRAFLFVANFGDRFGQRYASRSSLWRGHVALVRGAFERMAEVESFGATDAEHFVMHGHHFVALANEGDIQRRLHQTSVVYEVVVEGEGEAGEL